MYNERGVLNLYILQGCIIFPGTRKSSHELERQLPKLLITFSFFAHYTSFLLSFRVFLAFHLFPLIINFFPFYSWKLPVYIFSFGQYNFKQINVSGIQIFRAQLLALNLRKVVLNAANIYPFGFILTKCKYKYRSFIMILNAFFFYF